MRTSSPEPFELICVAPRPSLWHLARTRRSLRLAGEQVVLTVVRDLDEAARAVVSGGGWIGFIDQGDALEPGTLRLLRRHLEARPEADVAYTDEDTITTLGRLTSPRYKPDWSPDRLRCQPYLGRLTMMRRELVRDVGGLRPEYKEAAEFDLILRATERAREVSHVAAPLYHRRDRGRAISAVHDERAVPHALRSVAEHVRRTNVQARVAAHPRRVGLLTLEPALVERPFVSLVVPTRATVRAVRGIDTCLVEHCVRTVLERSTYDRLEIVCVVDEDVPQPVRAALKSLDHDRVRVIELSGAFHFSRKINHGAAHADGDVLILLNDDTEVITPGWIEAMLLYGLDPAIGAVGARLLFADDTIQHAGVVSVRGNPGHPYYRAPADEAGYECNALVPLDLLAVTGACLLTRRECFDAVGGLSPWFPINYNDLDFCLKLRREGWRVVCTPDAVLYHYESSTRSGEVAAIELQKVRKRWGSILQNDPYYGPNFHSPNADFVPADPGVVLNSL